MKNDEAYTNADVIPGAADYPARWAADAAAFRLALGRPPRVVPYGEGARQALDLFVPEGEARGLWVFVHGGYWRSFDRSFWSAFAAGPLARGWAVAMPSYTLAPAARIGAITAEVARAVDAAAGAVAGPVALAGHSAGGHLAARMLCADVALGCADRLARVMPISPVSDLRPFLETEMNADFGLDAAEAEAESPALQAKAREVPVTVWVGADERPAFLDQARWLAEAWGADRVVVPGRHHFDVIDGLRDGGSAMTEAAVGGI